MRNIALVLMYNGTAYHGWQVQKTEISVAETLERGLSMVCGEKIKCVGCGRTDAGVHAEYYVANFHTNSRIPVERIPFAVNTHIPEDIVVRRAYEVAEDFNAIGSCIKKESILTAFTIPALRIPSMSTGRISIPSGWMRHLWTARPGCSRAPTILPLCALWGPM